MGMTQLALLESELGRVESSWSTGLKPSALSTDIHLGDLCNLLSQFPHSNTQNLMLSL